ncbi:MAG TPA: hypothetical protein VGB96_18445, partial [Archangium sp.]
KDEARALTFFDKACTQGHGQGCFMQSRAYALGLGVPKDLARAKELLKKACDNKFSPACKGLPAPSKAP